MRTPLPAGRVPLAFAALTGCDGGVGALPVPTDYLPQVAWGYTSMLQESLYQGEYHVERYHPE